MEEQWKELAATAPGTLVTVALDTSTGLRGTVPCAHRILGAFILLLRMRLEGATPDAIRDAIIVRGELFGLLPSAVLRVALPELDRLAALHDRAAYAFTPYARRLAAALDPLLESWEGHRARAVSHARDAKRKLRYAASHARAAEDAIVTSGLRRFPRGSPGWTAWTSTSLRLALNAAAATGLALRALRRMRDEVALEFYDATRVLDR